MNIIKIKRGYKTTKAIEFALKKLKIGDVLFSSITKQESRRVFSIFMDIFRNSNVDFVACTNPMKINVFNHKLIFEQRDERHICGLKLHCAIIDNYNYNKKDEKFLYLLKPRLRKIKTFLPYYKNDYYPEEIFITMMRE